MSPAPSLGTALWSLIRLLLLAALMVGAVFLGGVLVVIGLVGFAAWRLWRALGNRGASVSAQDRRVFDAEYEVVTRREDKAPLSRETDY